LSSTEIGDAVNLRAANNKGTGMRERQPISNR
jgi:hypothetical protein